MSVNLNTIELNIIGYKPDPIAEPNTEGPMITLETQNLSKLARERFQTALTSDKYKLEILVLTDRNNYKHLNVKNGFGVWVKPKEENDPNHQQGFDKGDDIYSSYRKVQACAQEILSVRAKVNAKAQDYLRSKIQSFAAMGVRTPEEFGEVCGPEYKDIDKLYKELFPVVGAVAPPAKAASKPAVVDVPPAPPAKPAGKPVSLLRKPPPPMDSVTAKMLKDAAAANNDPELARISAEYKAKSLAKQAAEQNPPIPQTNPVPTNPVQPNPVSEPVVVPVPVLEQRCGTGDIYPMPLVKSVEKGAVPVLRHFFTEADPRDVAAIEKKVQSYVPQTGCRKLSYVISRIWNAIKAIFGASDWRVARKLMRQNIEVQAWYPHASIKSVHIAEMYLNTLLGEKLTSTLKN